MTPDAILRVTGLTITTDAGSDVIRNVTLDIRRGEILGVVGESGSGKSTLSLAMLGFCSSGLRFSAGEIHLDGRDLLLLSERQRRLVRGKFISYVPQDPPASLNPSDTVARTLRRMLRAHTPSVPAGPAIREAMELVDLPTDESFFARFPHQLSGGQQQRLAIAAAVICRPSVVVFDEPTTGLDSITQATVLAGIQRLHAATGMSIVIVSHDLATVERIADRTAVMSDGRVVEIAGTAELWARPQAEYTKELLAAIPRGVTQGDDSPVREVTAPSLLSVDALSVGYAQAGKVPVPVLKGATLEVRTGERLAVVGASGSGKSSLARCVAGLMAPDSGDVRLDGEQLPPLARRRSREQLRRVQIVFQNPYSALNPKRTVGEAIGVSLRFLLGMGRQERDAEVLRTLDLVGLPRTYVDRRPFELSGGERQRVAIGQAVCVGPDLLICDEVTSALDVRVQAQILTLLEDLSVEKGMALLFISHDLSVVAQFADRVVVLAEGQVVETGPPASLMRNPRHEYTKQLIGSAFGSESWIGSTGEGIDVIN